VYVVTHPWQTFIERWNWKAALLSALFRGAAFALPMARMAGSEALPGIVIEIGFRVAIGGFWGALLQAFRRAQPAWLASLSIAVILPAAAQVLEYVALQAGRASHLNTAMAISVIISVGSLLMNMGLMRQELLVTEAGSDSLLSDLRRIPPALACMVGSGLRACRRLSAGAGGLLNRVRHHEESTVCEPWWGSHSACQRACRRPVKVESPGQSL
jgi:hypothetical protein